MELNHGSHDHDEQIELPPGFRFHPTDEELISHYLYPKVFDSNFVARAIGDIDLNKFEPWDLPLRAKIGEKEWYFFCVRDKKYPTGLRTNRATEMGYWKATGKDKEIYKAKSFIGMKKTLVFYKGRAPKGEKTNWIMHEFRLEGKFAIKNLPKSAKGEWVISRVFEKIYKKNQISGLPSMNDEIYEYEFESSNLPPLLDVSRTSTAAKTETSNVPCKPQDLIESWFSNPCILPNETASNLENLQYLEPSIHRIMIDNDKDLNLRQNPKAESVDQQEYAMNLCGSVDFDRLWDF